VVAAAAEAGGVLGPLWGAAVLSQFEWPWIFYLNVPLVALLLGALRFAPAPGAPAGHSLDRSVDYLGGVLLGLSLGMLAIGLSQESARGWLPRVIFGGLAVAAAIGFVLRERRAASALVELRLFRRPAFSAANLVSLLSGVALIVAMVDVPLWSATILQHSAVEGGLLLMRMMAFIPVGAVLGGLLLRRIGPAATSCLGLAACAAGLWLLAQWRADTQSLQMTRDLALAGLGFGLQLAPLSAVVVTWAGAARAGVAAALVTVMRTIGMLIGVATLTSWGLDRFNGLVASLPLPLPALGEAAETTQQRLAEYQAAILEAGLTVFSEIFIAAASVCVIALLPALWLRLPRHAPS
jgi:MFS family permease